MNPKLENIKTALRLVIEQSEKKDESDKFRMFAKFSTGHFNDWSADFANYLTTAANMGAPMAKGMLDAILLIEQQIISWNHTAKKYESGTQFQQGVNGSLRQSAETLERMLSVIISNFSDPETTNTEAK